jgi:hypothetical protein
MGLNLEPAKPVGTPSFCVRTSADDLQSVVEKVDNSIAAVCKEIDLKRRFRVTEPMTVQIESPSTSEA